jgi:hypothetical protein
MQGLMRLGLAGLLGVLGAAAGYGQHAQQTVSLAKGWNAVYLQVEPDDARCSVVFGDWPVSSVSLYNMARMYAQFIESPSEPVSSPVEFLTWSPGVPAGANGFNQVLAGQSYLIYALSSCVRTLTGRPAVPRIAWVPSTNACNLVGFRSGAGATFGTYLSGAGFDASQLAVYAVSGTNSAKPTLVRVGGFTGLNTAPIDAAKAYFIACDKVSSFSGPVKVYPEGTIGLGFPTNSSYQTLRMKNESGSALAVTLTVTNSAILPSGAQPVLPPLQAFDSGAGWLPLTHLVRTLQPGEDWSLTLALDRTGMTAGLLYGGVLVCSDAAGGRVEVPLEAEYGPADPAHALWPAGLWVGKATLNQVSQVLSDGTTVDGAKAGGSMELRLILHVDTDQQCRLLQRVLIAGVENTNGVWSPSLYLDESKVPPGAKCVRISSVAFGSKNGNIVRDDNYFGSNDGFGKNLRFIFSLPADDSVNPFRHPYHPDHDGLDAKFKTELPFGDDPQNYVGEIKPELFSITSTITMSWTNAPAAGGASALWNPAEKVSGSVAYQVDGLRREGQILMRGAFELRRISQVGTLSLE